MNFWLVLNLSKKLQRLFWSLTLLPSFLFPSLLPPSSLQRDGPGSHKIIEKQAY